MKKKIESINCSAIGGEEIVFNLEKEYLDSIGKNELLGKVEWVSRHDDSLGYDIKSFEDDGQEKYVEVKSTSQSLDSNVNFLISSNQYAKAKIIKNYYFYILFDTRSKQPRVWKIKNPMQYESKGLILPQ